MHVTAPPAGDERRQHRLGFLGLLIGLATGGTTLLRVAGPPTLPTELPSTAILASTLNGSYVPPAAIAYLVALAAWLLWGWLALSVALRLIVVGAESIARGASWVRALKAISDHVTLPLVRRLVDGAVVTVLVVNLVARAAPAEASSISSSVTIVARSNGDATGSSPSSPTHESSRRTVQYTVQPGDTLWTISERFYGTGFEYGRLVRANVGSAMPEGSRFTRTGVIQPGWVLTVPLPSRAIEEVDGKLYYVVEDEDTLRGVAARLLGDEGAWEQIFEANRETARLPNGHTLTRPDLIWPGLRLMLPVVSANGATSTPPVAPSPEHEVPTSPVPPIVSPAVVDPPPEPIASPEVVASPAPGVTQASEPTPTFTPDPTETAVVVTPAAPATPAPTDAPTEAIEIDPAPNPVGDHRAVLGFAAAGLALLVAAGGAMMLALRRLRRRLVEPLIPAIPEEGPASNEGFAEAELARVFEHRIHRGEVEPAIIVADQAARFFEEHQIDQIDVVTVGQRHSAVSLTVDAGLSVQPRLFELAPELGARLGATGEAWRTADHDVLVRISGLKLAGLTPLTDRPADAAVLLPVGILPGRETLYTNWRELGHVLVAGLPGGGVQVVLTSLIGALTARCRPDDVRLLTIASRRTLPSPIFSLPHQAGGPIDPMDEAAVVATLQEIRSELEQRMQESRRGSVVGDNEPATRPELVVVIGELDDIQDIENTFELLGVHGAAHGIRMLAASTRPEALVDELLTHFTTRVALQTLDEDASIRLIGRGDAADLGSGGDLLVRIDGRVPIRARGFRLSPLHLDQLVKVMHEAYAGSTTPAANATRSEGGEPGRACSATRELDAAQHIGESSEDVRAADTLDPECQGQESVPSAAASGLAVEPRSRLNGHHPAPTDSAPLDTGTSGDFTVATASESLLPIQVRCFGTFRVTSGDRELSAAGGDGAHYKAWDILAFLCAQPGETVSRERLVTAMWPDVDSAKAANRLKVSLTRLRRMLKKQVPELTGEVVRVERSGVCRLNSDLISSDVHRFMALRQLAPRLRPAEAAQALEQARSLYRGDLLTEPYYEWVHTRADDGLTLREQYREEYFRVTQRLAELHRQQGQPARAVALYRDILKLEPTLEDVARNLYRCYQDLGDRGALVRENRRLREAIRQMMSSSDELEDPELYEPESETIALYEEILTDLEARSAVGRSA